MPPISNIVSYFRSCYQVDFRAIRILNFYGKNVASQLELKSTELLSGRLLQFPIDSKWGAEMEHTLAVHSQEKALYCCAFFLSGTMNVIGKPQKVFAPLYIYPVDLILEDGVYYLELQVENGVINPVFVEYIRTLPQDIDIGYDDLVSALPTGFIQFEQIFEIGKALQKLIPDLDVSQLEQYFNLQETGDLKSIYNKKNTDANLSLIPGIGIGLINKPSGSRGVLNELEKIATNEDYSTILKEIFNPNENRRSTITPRSLITPVILSGAQKQIFESYYNQPLSLVIGPPGTGKSFTIAALVADLITHGKTVLIASKNDQAGTVIANKIEKDFSMKGVVVKTSTRSYRSQLQKRLTNIIHGIEVQKIEKKALNKLELGIQDINRQIEKLESLLEKREKEELKWGAIFHNESGSILTKIRQYFIEGRAKKSEPIFQIMKELKKLYHQLLRKSKVYVKKQFAFHLYEVLRHERAHIQNLLNGLEEETGNQMQAYFDKVEFDAVLHALPAWIVNAVDVHTALPLRKELFDVVIIDEATQCDIASSIPLLQRAKCAVIVGDPKQLRHISFLSKSQQQQLLEKFELQTVEFNKINYRKNSLLDMVSASISTQNHVHFLDEHFRSMPDIIDFSNRQFYNSQLKIMTATPLTIRDENTFIKTCKGHRNTKGQNEKEAAEILEHVRRIIEKEKTFIKSQVQTIGIISPFRSQVNYLKRLIRKVIDTKEIRRHSILVGTPFEFQGEERDVILISFVVDDKVHPSTYLYLNRPDVFNVTITRARTFQYIYASVDRTNLNPKLLLRQYLDHIDSKTSKKIVSDYEGSDAFMEAVIKRLHKWKIKKILRAHPIAGIIMDIVVVRSNQVFAIDLVGYPGDFVNKFPVDRWKIMNRIGIKTFTLSYSEWHLNNAYTAKYLKKFIFENR